MQMHAAIDIGMAQMAEMALQTHRPKDRKQKPLCVVSGGDNKKVKPNSTMRFGYLIYFMLQYVFDLGLFGFMGSSRLRRVEPQKLYTRTENILNIYDKFYI